jgi:hypothetical protein
MYVKIEEAYNHHHSQIYIENYDSTPNLYGALKGNTRKCFYPRDLCACRQTIRGEKVNACLPINFCKDCNLNDSRCD